MKCIKIIFTVLFAIILLIPIAAFNFDEDAVSAIDNRQLAQNPLEAGGDLTQNIQDYVNDRIGLRDEMILAYTLLNDRLFDKMVHPSYVYGKEGYVFGAGLDVETQYTEFHEAFADMVKKVQDYCDERNVPFLFVFNPAKPAVMTEYVPTGINYNRDWVEQFFDALDKRGVRYLDNTAVLREKFEEGIMVFNQKYDANHWNDWGAYYGTQAMLEELRKDLPSIHITQTEELDISETLETSLPVSEFPINEMVPAITVKTPVQNISGVYSKELELNPSYKTFGYYVNQTRLKEGAPRALVFQGSYMNVYGYKYMANSFGEYIHVHDYQNIMDFSYYYNIFQPDCVIFEVAEYTFLNMYFNYESMCAMQLNPTLESAVSSYETQTDNLNTADINVQTGEALTKIQWTSDSACQYAWLTLDIPYDMKKTDIGYEVTVANTVYEQYKDELSIWTLNGSSLTVYE